MEKKQSPELTGDFRHAGCDNVTDFIGYDDRGFPGHACECNQDPCICELTLKQTFRVRDGEIVDYAAFDGGGHGAEIGPYTRIECPRCGAVLWQEALRNT